MWLGLLSFGLRYRYLYIAASSVKMMRPRNTARCLLISLSYYLIVTTKSPSFLTLQMKLTPRWATQSVRVIWWSPTVPTITVGRPSAVRCKQSSTTFYSPIKGDYIFILIRRILSVTLRLYRYQVVKNRTLTTGYYRYRYLTYIICCSSVRPVKWSPRISFTGIRIPVPVLRDARYACTLPECYIITLLYCNATFVSHTGTYH
jgi:hypothetical protein